MLAFKSFVFTCTLKSSFPLLSFTSSFTFKESVPASSLSLFVSDFEIVAVSVETFAEAFLTSPFLFSTLETVITFVLSASFATILLVAVPSVFTVLFVSTVEPSAFVSLLTSFEEPSVFTSLLACF